MRGPHSDYRGVIVAFVISLGVAAIGIRLLLAYFAVDHVAVDSDCDYDRQEACVIDLVGFDEPAEAPMSYAAAGFVILAFWLCGLIWLGRVLWRASPEPMPDWPPRPPD